MVQRTKTILDSKLPTIANGSFCDKVELMGSFACLTSEIIQYKRIRIYNILLLKELFVNAAYSLTSNTCTRFNRNKNLC